MISGTPGIKSEEEYFSEECIVKEDVAISSDWDLNGNAPSTECPTNKGGTLEYHSVFRRPVVKTEASVSSDDSEILIKKIEPVEDLLEIHTEFEYDEESDVSSEKFDPSDFFNGNASGAEMQTDIKPKIMTLQHWLQLPADEYARHCADLAIPNESEKDSSTDYDSDPQTSFTGNRLTGHQPQGSQTKRDDREPIMPPLQNTMQMNVASRPRVYSGDDFNNQYKRSLDSSRAKNTGVKKSRKTSSPDQLKSRAFNKTANNSRVKKYRKKRRQLDARNQESWHDVRRITRSSIKTVENSSPNNTGRDDIGKFVWGYCMGWWPAIIVAAEDGGLEPAADKVCVYWIGEDLISLLNTKTQVEPFSTNLDMRLIRYLRDEVTTRDRKKACFVTLKLFSKYLGIPLLKPYIEWARKHLVGKSHLNDLRFFPFPKNMEQRLDQLKRDNIKVKEKIARDEARVARLSKDPSSANDQELCDNLDQKLRDNGSRGKFPKDFVRKSTNELLLNSSQEERHILPLKDQKPGVIVWGKIAGHSWWPAMIIHNHDCGKKEPNFGCQWILWYGDYQLSQVNYLNIMKFDEGVAKMERYITQCRRERYMKAVLGACKDHCARLGYDTSNWQMKDVLAWISSLDSNSKMCAIARPNDGRLESRYSFHIAEKLNEMKSNQGIAAERENKIENCDALKAVFAGIPETLRVLCIVCLKICTNPLDHPFFECSICSTCVEELKATIFAYGDDGKCFYCTLCAGTDTVVMCDSYDCPRVYCTACLKYLICPSEYENILMTDPWLCFLCKDQNENRIFKPRSDWKTRIGRLFHTNRDMSWNEAWNNDGMKRKMRVLSLFDGISTGMLVLEKLGIVVGDYYASEIDVDAEQVSAAYFGKRICRLGDVRNIDKDIIEALAPIDLLIGGSPCNDLSLVNPNRRGLHDPKGTGILFFDYCRVKELVTEANKGHHLFWLFENVASMPSVYRLAINESLRCEPSLIDAADFSPQHRPRLFWGNLPNGVNFPPPDPSQDLQSVLTPNCNRHALVKKIRTVTTKVNSLKQGISLLKPVLMNGEADSLWITELEEIFGFPKHYTDVKNLSATKRQKLIGQAWSVQTISALLLPLRYFFATESLIARN